MLTVRYTEWDGTQRIRLGPARAFGQLAEILSCAEDLQQALDLLLRGGLDLADGTRVMGLDDLLAALRNRREELYRRFNLDHVFDEFRARPDRSMRRALEEFCRRRGKLFQGSEALDYEAALALMRELQGIERIEGHLSAGRMEDVEPEDLYDLLGAPASQDFVALRGLTALLEEAGYLSSREGRVTLSGKGVRKLGRLALRDIYQGLLRDRGGDHPADFQGVVEALRETTRPYRYGDAFDLDLVGTLKRCLTHDPAVPLRLSPDDFQVFERRNAARASTVLLLDMSWSMSWEGRFGAAKKVALALESLIQSRYPRDYFGVVGFYTRARELRLRDLPEATWNMGDPFTNLQDGLHLASEMLKRHPSANQHMIVVTDGQPTAYFRNHRLYCEWPLSFGGLSLRAAEETLREVERVTRGGVVINTFMLDDSPSLRGFVEKMTRINKGRAFFTRPDRLGEYLLIDYIAGKRKRV